MIPQKTIQQREKELRALLATAAGQKELSELEARNQKASGKRKRENVEHHLHPGPREGPGFD
jgi:hypothetical protein